MSIQIYNQFFFRLSIHTIIFFIFLSSCSIYIYFYFFHVSFNDMLIAPVEKVGGGPLAQPFMKRRPEKASDICYLPFIYFTLVQFILRQLSLSANYLLTQ